MQRNEGITREFAKTLMTPDKFNDTYARRFFRLMDLYELNNDDAVKFITMVVDQPELYKNDDLYTQTYSRSKSFGDTYDAIIKVCDIPEFKHHMGDRYEEIINAHKDYRTHVMNVIKRMNKDETKHIQAPISNVVEDGVDDDEDSDQGEVEIDGDDKSDDIDEDILVSKKRVIGRLRDYIALLNITNEPKTIAAIIEMDIKFWLP